MFDKDGVLVDSEAMYFAAMRETFGRYGVDITEEVFVKNWILNPYISSRGTIDEYGLGAKRDEIEQVKAVQVTRFMEQVQMIPYARELLATLRQGSYRMGLVSSASDKEVAESIEKFSLSEFFSVIVTGSQVKNRKPHPEPYRKGVELLGANPARVVVVEDNPVGVVSGKAAGCRVIAYPNGFTKDMDFGMADLVVYSLSEIDEGMLEQLVA